MEKLNEKTSEDKLVAIISYVTLIGWIVAYVMFKDEKSGRKTEFNVFHIRQSLGINILFLVSWVVDFIPFIGGILYTIVSLAILVFWILGLVAAVNGEMKEIPVVGNTIQDTLKSIN